MARSDHPVYGGGADVMEPPATAPKAVPPDSSDGLPGVEPECCPVCGGPSRPHCSPVDFPSSTCRWIVCVADTKCGYGRSDGSSWSGTSVTTPRLPYGPDDIGSGMV